MMNADRYRQACELFDAALALPTTERDGFLEQACSADSDLWRQVERLIEHDRHTAGLLDRPPILHGDDQIPPDSEVLSVGSRLGAYRITGSLGQGGMGVVYLAVRDDDEFQRQVAIKVVRQSGAGAENPWRFLRERQILAQLEHPNIARLYDGGTTEGQKPYLVMEYIDGLPITTYCDHHRLTIADRLGLIQKVCAAVQYAHRNLIIHRDLKPSNILVDSEGEPKLLDFGIAKLVDPLPSAQGVDSTRDHHRIMTLSHASPEQVLGTPVTTASDIYGVGLVLYELLCSQVPFSQQTSPYELLRSITESPPLRPSTVVVNLTSEAKHVGRDRSTSTEKLKSRLVGDLDAIAEKVLRKEPEQRYATATQLARDLSRHLEDQPVAARSPDWGYRLGKLFRRHRAAIVVAVSSAVLIAGLVAAFISALLAQVDRTEREKKKVERILGFLTETFSLTHPDASVGETVTARELLDQGANRISVELESEPDVRATVLSAMGRIYFRIGLIEPAKSLLQQGLDQRLSLEGNHHADIAESLTYLGEAQRTVGQLEEAEKKLRKAVEIGRSLGDGDRVGLAQSLESLAMLERLKYRYEEAETLYTEAVDIRRKAGVKDRGLAQALSDLGSLLQEQGDFGEARALYQESLVIRRARFGGRHPEVADTLQKLAYLEYTHGDHAAAQTLYEKALSIYLEAHGENHRVVDLINSMALAAGRQGKLETAARLHRESLDGMRRLAGTEHPDYATVNSNLAVALTRLGHFSDAATLLAESLEIRVRLLGEGHPLVGQTHLVLGDLHHRQGHLEEAEKHYVEAAAIATTLPAGHRAIAYPNQALARLRIDLGRYTEAEKILRKVLVELRTSHRSGHWRIAMATASLGRSQAHQNHFELAEDNLLEALDMLNAVSSDDPARKRQVLQWVVELYRRWNRPESARGYEDRLLELEEK